MPSKSASGSNKTWVYIGIAALAVLVAILVAVSISGGGDDELGGVEDATARVEGIPSQGFVLGQPNAPVTIIEVLDPQCPHCAQASKAVVPDVIERFVKTGQAKLQMVPVSVIPPQGNGERAAKALFAAGQQKKAWLFADVLLHNQEAEGTDWLDDGMVTSVAEAIGLDMAKFNSDRGSAEATKAAEAGMTFFQVNNVSGTPTFKVRNTKTQAEVTLPGFTPADFDAGVAAVLGAQ